MLLNYNIRKYIQRFPVIFIILICYFSRLSQLLSPNLFLDADECVTAMMAKHLWQGKDFSLFFWGQRYGLTIFESGTIAIFYSFLGISTLSVKLSMLCLWTIGVIFIYKSLLQINPKDLKSSFLLTTFFITLSAWAVWSMKARGGYITAFVLSSLFVYLLFHSRLILRNIIWLIMGVLLELIFESQAIFLIGILPLLFAVIQERKIDKMNIVYILSGFCALYCFFAWYKTSIIISYEPALRVPELTLLPEYLGRFPEYLFKSLTGYYYFSNYYKPDIFSLTSAFLMIISLLLLVVYALYSLFNGKTNKNILIYYVLFIPGFWVFSIFTPLMEFRYLLPISFFSTISLGILLNNFKIKFFSIPSLFCAIIVGFISAVAFWNFQFEGDKRKHINELISFLQKKQIHYCFSRDTMIPWHLIFYSNETIIARTPYSTSRHQAYHKSVDSNFFAGGKTAYIGFNQYKEEYNSERVLLLNTFFVEENPDKCEILDIFNPQNK